MIGTFADIVFEVSREQVLTFAGFTRSGEANFAEHAVLDDKPRLQFTGVSLDEIQFSVRLDISLGVDPAEQVRMMRRMLAAGEARPLIVGEVFLGDFVLVRLEESWTNVDNLGNLLVAELALSLREYI
jgi:phage protein U